MHEFLHSEIADHKIRRASVLVHEKQLGARLASLDYVDGLRGGTAGGLRGEFVCGNHRRQIVHESRNIDAATLSRPSPGACGYTAA